MTPYWLILNRKGALIGVVALFQRNVESQYTTKQATQLMLF